MSDLLAVADPGASYIAAYPLKGAARHVLARTWAAGRDYRPGSVWTHSLILDYRALTVISDLIELRRLFRKPEENDHRLYRSPVQFETAEKSNRQFSHDMRSRNALQQLYNRDPQRIITLPRHKDEEDELLALSLWRQMWPGLRRDFAFFINSDEGIPNVDCGCILRFSAQSDIVDLQDIDPDQNHGLRALLADLPKPGPTPLRQYIGRYVIESAYPRRLAAPLASLRENDDLPLQLKLQRVSNFAPGERLPRLVKDIVLQEFNRVTAARDLVALVGAVRNETADVDLAGTIDRAWNIDDRDLRELLAATQPSFEGQVGDKLFSELVKMSAAERLAAAATSTNRLAIARIRPEVRFVPAFWPTSDAERADLIEQIGKAPFEAESVRHVFGQTIGPRTALALLSSCGDVSPTVPLWLIEIDDAKVGEIVADWIVQTPSRLRAITNLGRPIGRRALERLAVAQIQDGASTPEPEIWAGLIITAFAAEPSSVGALNAISYMAALALSGDTSLTLAKLVYDPLQSSVRKFQLSADERNYLSRHISDSRSLTSALAQSAIAKWPPTVTDIGALTLSTVPVHQYALVDEVADQQGRTGLELSLQSGLLPEHIQRRIRRKLEPRLNRRMSSFDWFFGDD